mmetsp:Transcript_20045/g.43452  ORF Transcript_20045/g.43452 Transcript_20045/m.43452 type:complete len:202 (+) Transcript_20045:4942-5547(+)
MTFRPSPTKSIPNADITWACNMGVSAASKSPSREDHAPKFTLFVEQLLLLSLLLALHPPAEEEAQWSDNCPNSIAANGPPWRAAASNARPPPGEVPFSTEDSRAAASRDSAALTSRSTVLLMATPAPGDDGEFFVGLSSFFSTWENTFPPLFAATGINVVIGSNEFGTSGVNDGGAMDWIAPLLLVLVAGSGCMDDDAKVI